MGVRRALDEAQLSPVFQVRVAPRDRKTDTPVAEVVRHEPALAIALREGCFVTTVEMEPPKSPNTSELEKKALLLRDAGATTLNISDTPMARMV